MSIFYLTIKNVKLIYNLLSNQLESYLHEVNLIPQLDKINNRKLL